MMKRGRLSTCLLTSKLHLIFLRALSTSYYIKRFNYSQLYRNVLFQFISSWIHCICIYVEIFCYIYSFMLHHVELSFDFSTSLLDNQLNSEPKAMYEIINTCFYWMVVVGYHFFYLEHKSILDYIAKCPCAATDLKINQTY